MAMLQGYKATELPCKRIAQSKEDLFDLYFLATYFETVILRITEDTSS